MPAEPTSRQRDIAAFIESQARVHGAAPTEREIQHAFGFASRNSVRSHLRLMEQKGMLTRTAGRARGLKLTHVVEDGIRLLGRIPAGGLAEAVQSAGDVLPISRTCFRGDDLFALTVKGESMRDAGILSGDIAVLNRQAEVREGEIAAVLLDEDATLKYFHRHKGAVVLRAANPVFSDIVIRADGGHTVRILGRFVGLVRTHGGRA